MESEEQALVESLKRSVPFLRVESLDGLCGSSGLRHGDSQTR